MKSTHLLVGLAWMASIPTLSHANTEFAACLAQLRPSAIKTRVSPAAYDQYTQNLTPDLSLLDKLNYQPEFRTPIWDYLAGLVDEERVQEGQIMLRQHASTLKQVEQRYGVDAASVVAVWGVESNFGQSLGKVPLLQALGTLSCYGRRQAFFRGEFYSALRIVQAGDVSVEQFRGSWAGAFGHTQFMPTTFERLAVDFDGDGKRDLMNSEADALASTANFLRKAGWQTGKPWGIEVRLPAGFNPSGEKRTQKRSLQTWVNRGLVRVDGTALVGAGAHAADKAGLLLPAGINGPAFLVFKNFDAFYSYNAAESYGLAIAHLADRLRGGKAFARAWPTDDIGLSRAERRELQTLLIAKGYALGAADGMLGDKSRQAIKAEEARLGWPVTGRGGQKILQALRSQR